MTPAKPPRVFVSYSHQDKTHFEKVRGLAASLRRDGIDCRFDQFLESSPPKGWALWMEEQIRDADVVLVICSSAYLDRLNKGGQDKGLGSTFESHLIYQLLYESGVDTRKFKPIIFSEEDRRCIPLALRSETYFLLSDDSSYEMLLRAILERPILRLPQIGSPPDLSSEVPEPLFSRPHSFGATGSEHINAEILAPLQNALAAWRLFDFQRDILLESIYVQELLRDPVLSSPLSPLFSLARTTAKPQLESQIFSDFMRRAKSFVIIEGKAGAGKSTMARSWALRLIRRDRPVIPLYVALRNIPENVGAFSHKEVIRGFEATVPAVQGELLGLVRHLLSNPEYARPQMCLILDGFDEMPPQLQVPLLKWLPRLPERWPVVITSRPGVFSVVGYPTGTRVFEICDFSLSQIREFTSKWFSSAPSLGQGIFAAIDQRAELKRIACIPLLLACLCIDVDIRQRFDFPERILESDLLERAVVIMIDKWDASKEGREVNHQLVGFGMDLLTSIISPNYDYNTRINFADIVRAAVRIGKSHGLSEGACEDLLSKMIRGGRIIEGRAEQGVSFSHKVFFDFFFSRKIRSLRRAKKNEPRGRGE